jgi:hypothetical protein
LEVFDGPEPLADHCAHPSALGGPVAAARQEISEVNATSGKQVGVWAWTGQTHVNAMTTCP